MTRRATLVAAGLVLPLLLGACGSEDVKVSSPSRTAASGGDLTLDGPGKVLTEEQVGKALVGKESTPDAAWVEDSTAGDSDPEDADIEPKDCDTWFADWDAARKKARHRSSRTFNKNGDMARGSLRYAVLTFDDPADASQRQQLLAKAPTVCGSYTQHLRTSQGQRYDAKWEMKSSTFARPGDASQSVENKITYTDPVTRAPQTRYMQIAIVQVGHNELYLQSYGAEKIDDAALNKLLTDGFARLEAASR